ncbi:MAG: hypothetical protein Q9O74_03635 [Planctomycetota bacterium]|nr:hypothetical protein [Planctomycetota bacterium]
MFAILLTVPAVAAPLASASVGVLAWRPFFDPLDLHRQWFLLLIPLAFGIAVTYRAVRVNTFERYWLKTVILTVQIVLAMILLGTAAYVFIQFAVPYLLPMTG